MYFAIYVIVSILINAFGVLFNVLNLWFFITSCRKGVSNHLIITLGLLDTVLCIIYLCSESPSLRHYDRNVILCKVLHNFCLTVLTQVTMSMAGTLMITSGLTCALLNMLRSLCILFPFYKFRKRIIYALLPTGAAVFGIGGYFCICEKQMIYTSTLLGFFIVMAVISVAVGTPAMHILNKASFGTTEPDGAVSPIQRNVLNQRKAANTIFILTALFFVTNCVGFSSYFMTYWSCRKNSVAKEADYYFMIAKTMFSINSCCNPLLLIARKKEAHEFLKKKIKALGQLGIKVFLGWGDP